MFDGRDHVILVLVRDVVVVERELAAGGEGHGFAGPGDCLVGRFLFLHANLHPIVAGRFREIPARKLEPLEFVHSRHGEDGVGVCQQAGGRVSKL